MNEYEYAVQWRWIGEGEWQNLTTPYQKIASAERDAENLKYRYPKAETRIVRRPVVEWEVVE